MKCINLGARTSRPAFITWERGRLVRMSLTLILIFLAAAIMSGCAGYKINDDGSVETWGVLRTLTVKREYHASGQLKSEAISTDSTTKDFLMGLNEVIDTAVDTASKIKP